MSQRSRAIDLLILALFAGAACVVASAGWSLAPRTPSTWTVVPILLAVLISAASLLINVRFRDELLALTLFEAALAPAFVALPVAGIVGMTIVAWVAAEALHHVPRRKAVFNVAQWSLAAAIGAVVFATIAPEPAATLRTAIALLAAMSTVAVVNTLSVALVVSLAGGEQLGRIVRDNAPKMLLNGGVNSAFGAIFAAAYLSNAYAIVLAFVPLVTLHYGFRGYASVLADRRRLSGLHHATETLAVPMNPRDALPQFVTQVRACFEAERVELLLPDAGVIERADADGSVVTIPASRSESTTAIARSGAVFDATADAVVAAALECEGYRDCMSSPLLSGERVLGVLCVYNRGGVEGSRDGDRAVLDALARAAAAALQRSSLFEEILEERRKLADIVEYASDGILTADPAGTILTWNPAFQKITGHHASEMIGSTSLAVLRPRDEQGADVWLERWAEDPAALPKDLIVTTPAGDARSLECSYTVMPGTDRRPATLVMVARDSTQVREAERLREDFVAAVSHELRTPLTPIKGFASTLIDHGESLGASGRESAARSIARQADRLERLITNLLEMTKVERGHAMRPDEIADPTGAVAKVVGDFRATNPDRIMRVSLPVECGRVRGDTLWIEQIVSNLLSNALKYSPAAEPIEVAVMPARDRVEIVVQDGGRGIRPADRERVFDRFHRLADDVTRSTGGAGIGLYISRHLARMMDGEIVVAPSDRGARFVLTLRTVPALASVS